MLTLLEEAIRELKAGRATDHLVAEALGHTVCDRQRAIELSNIREFSKPAVLLDGTPIPRTGWDHWYAHDLYLEDSLTDFGMSDLPHYSEDYGDVLTAIDFTAGETKIRLDSIHICTTRNGNWYCNLSGAIVDEVPTLPLAICQAILLFRHNST